MKTTKPSRLRGVLAPVVTPFHTSLAVNTEAFIDHCRWLVDNGAGLAIFGTNSEANSLSFGERIQLTDALLEAGIPATQLMPGTGTCSLPDTISLTKHAVEAGCAGALMLPPFFYKNVSDDGLFDYYSAVIEGVADERLSLYLYHIPAMSGVPITLSLIERLMKRYPETLAGVKDSSGDWNNTKAMIDAFAKDGLAIFPASEALLSKGMPIGGAGCISATANVNPAAISKMCAAWNETGADALQEQLTRIRMIFQGVPMIAAMKQAIAHFTGDDEWRVVRPPLTSLPATDGEKLLRDLEAAGFDMPGVGS